MCWRSPFAGAISLEMARVVPNTSGYALENCMAQVAPCEKPPMPHAALPEATSRCWWIHRTVSVIT